MTTISLPPQQHQQLDPGEPYRGRPVPRALGWALPGGGRAASAEPGVMWQGTTTQVCGMFPFAVSSGAAPPGVPIGHHMHTAEPVGLDPAEWLRQGLVSNTGMWIQGQPGIGKSTIVKRLMTGLVAFGFTAVVPGDVKGEYTRLVEHLDGRVWRIGRGLHSLNPLDAGPLRAALAQTSGDEHARLSETIRARRLSLLEALVVIVRRAEISVTERRLLGAALDLCVDGTTDGEEPIIPDVVRILVSPPLLLLDIAACDSTLAFRRDARDLVNTLELLCAGAIRGLFDRQSSITADLDTPALSLDISALDDDEDEVVAAAMLSSWAWAAAVIDGSAATGRHRNIFRIQDELWRALRVAPGLVERSDRVTRLGRHRGEISAQVTHSLDDLEALPTEADRAKARGMAQRNGVMVLGGMADKELAAINEISPLTASEAAMVRAWAAPPTWMTGSTHPGRGRYLIKSGERMGLPVALSLMPSERDLYNTDTAWQPRTGHA
ncbi:hypothetical protein [Pseudonocardia alni]|uniref:hypothetical protein n=1 Tax=Pseudonocardia alni TaxID=33907 RepID=UPI0033C3BB91